MPAPTQPRDLFHQLVKSLSDVLGPCSGLDSDDIDPKEIEQIMEAYTSNALEWQRYAMVDPYMNYTRNRVDEGNGKSNLLLLVWNPGKGSPIHDHANAHCVMKLLKGSLKETLYSNPSGPGRGLQITKETIYSENEVTYIHDKIGLHKISNPSSTETAVSLHLYTPPHAANFGFNVYREDNGYAIHLGPTGFFSERGRKVPKSETAINCCRPEKTTIDGATS